MPSMADITVKDAAAADVVYNAATPSSGDKVPARWTQNSASGIAGFRPSLEVLTRSSAQGTRRMESTFTFPVTYTDSATGLQKALAPVKITRVVFLPDGLTVDQWNEANVQESNLQVSSLIRDVVKTGYAPT